MNFYVPQHFLQDDVFHRLDRGIKTRMISVGSAAYIDIVVGKESEHSQTTYLRQQNFSAMMRHCSRSVTMIKAVRQQTSNVNFATILR